MKRFYIEAALVNFSEKIRPILVRLLPIGMLRRAKKGMIDSSVSKLKTEKYAPFSRSSHPDGINLIGYIRGEIGLGQSCRLVAEGIWESGLDFTVYNYDLVSAIRFNDHSWDHKITDTAPYNINIIHINPYELPLAYLRIGRETWDKRYNVAFWLWELEKFPEQWKNALDLVDEIWTPSEFASASIKKATQKPVYTIPYAFRTPDKGTYARKDFGLPEDKFLVLCMYDCNSFIERKNPMAAIRAFKKAFPADAQDAGLVIKINNPQEKDFKKIRSELAGYRNVHYIDSILDKTKTNALIACVDAYVTLHRSEGFGLVPAEAMALGTPVIATNWSSNTEFMDENTACMVDFEFITIEKDQGPYAAGNRWADANVSQAADYMRKLYEDDEYRSKLIENAKNSISATLAPKRIASLIQARVDEIYSAN
ncbi:MAG: glycosyltransferase family 4 protein [Oscillospiraceae bacterium]|nr:glycosyltransferase family 4 protein [Oscillospiraceae bacterium]